MMRTDMLRKFLHAIKPLFTKHYQGSGGVYVVALLGLVAAASYLITGGLLPTIEQNPLDAEHVQIDDTSISANRDSLQLVNIEAIPSPTPSGPTPTGPTPTGIFPPPPACSEGVVVALLADVSGSMGGKDVEGSLVTKKIDNLKAALHQFVSVVPQDTTIASLFPFATFTFQYTPFDYLKNDRVLVDQAISALSISDRGDVVWQGQTLHIGKSTYMKDAFETVGPKLLEAKNAFPNGRAYLVFMSDGVPETNICEFNKNDGRYYVGNYVDNNTPVCNVTLDTHPQNPVAASRALQDQGVEVFTIGLYGARETNFFQDAVKKVMRDTASTPKSTYYLESPTSAELAGAYQTIASRICQ